MFVPGPGEGQPGHPSPVVVADQGHPCVERDSWFGTPSGPAISCQIAPLSGLEQFQGCLWIEKSLQCSPSIPSIGPHAPSVDGGVFLSLHNEWEETVYRPCRSNKNVSTRKGAFPWLSPLSVPL